MATARKRQISLTDTKYYHCISRCVRRAFLCGEDKFTGKSYEHRRDWVEEKLLMLATVFCIDVCAYAVMSNHTHIVLYVDDRKAKRLSDKAVVIRWHKLFKGNWISQKFIEGEPLNESEQLILDELGKQPKSLLRFAGSPRKHMPKGLPFELKSYIELVELTGQCIRADKRGYINEAQPILTRLNIEPENWIKLTTQFSRVFHGAVGRERTITAYCETLQKRRRTNLTNSKRWLA
ncbi:transposase [Pseudoalteromonas piscicida]|uniref:transposase n=1 Tax=Pseudoalteromonas piscicida TaxID=43662 RepID=UPI000E35A6D7|nr:transposase [Pseudoalteromonas piscicida]AXR00115.1 transposase [Pseudoalteromonas piscicida]